MGKDKFLRGALILTVAGLMVKVIGSVNRILLSRLLGGEGIGLYQMAYPFYLLMLSICSAGVPVAVSIIVAEKVAKDDYAQAHRVFKVTLGLMAAFGLVFSLVLYGSAGLLVNSGWIRDSRAYYALVVLTPAVFFSSILASFRGYFQGYQMMTAPAVSQILEQLIRVMTMIGLAYFLLPYGLEYAAAGAAFGAIPGGLAGLLVLSWFYGRARKQWKEKIDRQIATEEDSIRVIAKRLFLLAVPVSCANLLIPVTSSIDMHRRLRRELPGPAQPQPLRRLRKRPRPLRVRPRPFHGKERGDFNPSDRKMRIRRPSAGGANFRNTVRYYEGCGSDCEPGSVYCISGYFPGDHRCFAGDR